MVVSGARYHLYQDRRDGSPNQELTSRAQFCVNVIPLFRVLCRRGLISKFARVILNLYTKWVSHNLNRLPT